MLILAVSCPPRFKPHFPEAHDQHYPNAAFHHSSQTCASLRDGETHFEIARSEQRRPFTEEEDRALRAGYGGHGTIWAQIVKDSIIQEQRRLSVDLRDLLNLFPGLYEGAREPRTLPKKERIVDPVPSLRAATNDEPPSVLVGPPRRKRTNTDERLSRNKTENTQSATNSGDALLRTDSSHRSVTTPSSGHPIQLLTPLQVSPATSDPSRLSRRLSPTRTKNIKIQGSFLLSLFASVFPPRHVTRCC